MAGATPKLVVQIIANTAELIKNINAGKGAIEAYGPSIAKMQETWARNSALVIQQAALITVGLKGINLATLTVGDAAKNLKQLEAGMAQLAAIGKPVPPLMQETADKLRAVRDTAQPAAAAVEGLGARVTGLVAAGAATQAAFRDLIGVVGNWIQSASAQENAAVRLDTALRAQGTYTPILAQQYARLASQFQATTVYSDELVTEMQALLIQVGGVLPKDMKAALTASTDLAAGLRIDLQTATQLVGKAFAGETGTLKRYGIIIDEVDLKTRGAAAVIDAIAEKMGGQATAQAVTFSGEMQRMGNIVDDVKESLGGLIASALKPVVDVFVALPEPVRTSVAALGLLGGAAAALSVAVAGVSAAIALALPLVGFTAAGAGTAALGLLSTAAGGLTTALGALFALLGPVSVALLALASGYALGTWLERHTTWARKLSDSFQYASLRVQGFSAAEADAMIATTHATEAGRTHAVAVDQQVASYTKAAPTVVAYSEQLRKAIEDVAHLTTSQRAEVAAAQQVGASTEDITKRFHLSEAALKLLNEQTKQHEAAQKKSAAEVKQSAAEFEKLTDDVKKLESALFGIPSALSNIGTSVNVANFVGIANDLAKVEQNARILNFGYQGMAAELAHVGEKTTVALDAMDGWAWQGPKLIDVKVQAASLGDVLGLIAGNMTQLAQIGGDSFSAIARGIGTAVKQAEMFVKAAEGMAKGGQAAAAGWAGFAGIWIAIWQHGRNQQQEAMNAMEAVVENWKELQRILRMVNPGLKMNDDALAQIGQTALDSQSLVSNFFLDMVAMARAAGIELTQLNAIMRQWAKQATDGFDAVMKGFENDWKALDEFRKHVDDAKNEFMDRLALMIRQGVNFEQALEKAGNKGAFKELLRDIDRMQARYLPLLNDLGTTAMGAFNAARASGLSFLDALRSVSPGLAELQEAFKNLGLTTGDAALQQLFLINTMLRNNPALLGAVNGLTQSMTALFNMGRLNADQFGAMQRTGAELYTRLQSEAARAGGTTRDALLPMQDWLHQARDAAERLGVPLDANTQEMILQSQQLGIWSDKGPSAADAQYKMQQVLLKSTERLTERLGEFIDALNDMVHDDALGDTAGAAAGVHTELGYVLADFALIPASLPDPFAGWHIPTMPTVSAAPGGALGGLVTPAGIQYLARGSARVLPFVPRGTDTVPAMLTPGESVLTVGATRTLGPARVAYLNRGGSVDGLGPAGGGPVHITIQAWDGASVDEWLRRGGAKKLAEATVPEIPGVVRSYGLGR